MITREMFREWSEIYQYEPDKAIISHNDYFWNKLKELAGKK